MELIALRKFKRLVHLSFIVFIVYLIVSFLKHKDEHILNYEYDTFTQKSIDEMRKPTVKVSSIQQMDKVKLNKSTRYSILFQYILWQLFHTLVNFSLYFEVDMPVTVKDIYISVKTSKKYHKERIGLILDTWYNWVKEEV